MIRLSSIHARRIQQAMQALLAPPPRRWPGRPPRTLNRHGGRLIRALDVVMRRQMEVVLSGIPDIVPQFDVDVVDRDGGAVVVRIRDRFPVSTGATMEDDDAPDR